MNLEVLNFQRPWKEDNTKINAALFYYEKKEGDILNTQAAQNALKRIITQLEEVQSSNKLLYQSSKDKLNSLATACQQAIKLISNILQDEFLAVDFEDPHDCDIMNAMAKMSQDINQLQAFVPKSISSSKTEPVKQSSANKRRMIAEYANVLNEMRSNSSPYSVVDSLSQLIWDWFETRFLKYRTSTFRYNIRRIPEWIYDIVIVYGQHVENKSVETFLSDFHAWLSRIDEADGEIPHAVPYTIYQVNKSLSSSDMSLASVVLYDILIDSGLSRLCNPDSEFYLDKFWIYNKCGQLNPSCLDDYIDYKLDSKILDKCKISSYWR